MTRALLIVVAVLSGCAGVRPSAELCSVPSILPSIPSPPPLPDARTFGGGCWFVGVKVKL